MNFLKLKKNKIIFLVCFLFIIASFLIIPTEEVHGFIPLLLLNIGQGIGAIENAAGLGGDVIIDAILGALSNIIGAIISFSLGIGTELLSFALSNDFISQSGSDSNVVQKGWEIVKNLANAALVIGLVIIAINIILGKDEGQAKKTLISFVIVALLINFTPLICGFFIDGANIIARSFIGGGIDNGSFLNEMDSLKSLIGNSGKDILEILVGFLFLLVFALVSSFIYILYALLFIVRSVILWILIIVSPIALATKVFPKSEVITHIFPNITHWDEWYKSFLQWCFIVIPAGLFIYLANISMIGIQVEEVVVDSNSQVFLSNILTSLFSFLVPFIILLGGFFITISSGGAVAAPLKKIGSSAFNKAKSGAMGAARWTKEGAIGTAGAAVKAPGSYLESRQSGKGVRESLTGTMNFEARESGRRSIEGKKEGVKGWGRRNVKERLHIGEDQNYATRSLEADKNLIEKPEDYFKGESKKDIEKEIQIAEQRIKVTEKRGDKEKTKKLSKSLLIAMANNENVSNERIKNFETEFSTDLKKVSGKMSGDEFSKKFTATAINRAGSFSDFIQPAHIKYIKEKGSPAQQTAIMANIGRVQEIAGQITELNKTLAENPNLPNDASNKIKEQISKLTEEGKNLRK